MDVIEAFIKLDHSSKIDKLKHLVEIFAPYSRVAKDTLELIHKYPDPLIDEEMINVYGLFIKAIQETKSDSLQEAVAQLSSIQQKLLEIHRREQAEKQGDNADDILKQI